MICFMVLPFGGGFFNSLQMEVLTIREFVASPKNVSLYLDKEVIAIKDNAGFIHIRIPDHNSFWLRTMNRLFSELEIELRVFPDNISTALFGFATLDNWIQYIATEAPLVKIYFGIYGKWYLITPANNIIEEGHRDYIFHGRK